MSEGVSSFYYLLMNRVWREAPHLPTKLKVVHVQSFNDNMGMKNDRRLRWTKVRKWRS